jgi:hypothetical protein
MLGELAIPLNFPLFPLPSSTQVVQRNQSSGKVVKESLVRTPFPLRLADFPVQMPTLQAQTPMALSLLERHQAIHNMQLLLRSSI